jgi:hypothetical protein
MTKKHIHIAAAVLSLASVTGCTDSTGRHTAESLTTKTVTVERTIRLTDSPNSPFYDIKIDLTYFTPLQDEIARRMNQKIVRYVMDTTDLSPKEATRVYINQLYNDYRREMLDFYLADLKENNGDVSGLPNYNYAYHLDTEVNNGYKGTIVYKLEGYRYSAGAHGINMHQYLNFDKDGNTLSLTDIFEEGFETELLRIVTQELMKKFHVTTTEALRDKGFVDATQLYVTENFELDDDEIEFVYNEYEIAPYCMGTIKVDIDYKDIKHLMKKEWR